MSFVLVLTHESRNETKCTPNENTKSEMIFVEIFSIVFFFPIGKRSLILALSIP